MARDLRKFARQTNLRLIVGGLILLFLVGDGLIYLIYGAGAAALGLICLAVGMVPVLLIVGLLFGMEWLVKKADREA